MGAEAAPVIEHGRTPNILRQARQRQVAVIKRTAANAGIECINCAICYAACDVVAWKPDYLGPAALNRAWTLINDARDVGRTKRLNAVAGDAGCHSCHAQQGCALNCPNELNPTASIAGLKRATAKAFLKGEI